MNVKQLKEALELYPDRLQVIIETNHGASPLSDSIQRGYYQPDSQWEGDLLAEEDVTPEMDDIVHCLVLRHF